MEFISQYADGDDDTNQVTQEPLAKRAKIDTAPQVAPKLGLQIFSQSREIRYNAPLEVMYAPLQGPSLPYQSTLEKNCWTGYVEEHAMSTAVFDQQFHTYKSYGYAADPTTSTIVGDLDRYQQNKGATIFSSTKRQTDRKRKRSSYSTSGEYVGPWGPSDDELEEAEIEAQEAAAAAEATTATATTTATADETALQKPHVIAVNASDSISDEVKPTIDIPETTRLLGQEEIEAVEASKDGDKEETVGGEEDEQPKAPHCEERTVFYGDELYDYQGRSYLHPPTFLKNMPHECYLPKKKLHSYAGHSKGVQVVRLFPNYGHIAISGGSDSTIKIWDIYNQHKLLRSITGHTKGIRDIAFSKDGSRFMSSSYDRWIKLWDTETGQCISRFYARRIPFNIKFHPEHHNEAIAACSDKRVIQWDTHNNKIIQQYDRHLGSVNTVTFIDNGRRFVTTSDDKSIRVWEWGIPVEIKYISEPHMHAIPTVAVHPNGKWIACQSLDNQILVYGATDRFKLNRKKRFTGHVIAGYGCQLGFSPDGKFLMSGDSEGNVWFWNWKTTRVCKKMQCHEKVCIGLEWHPIEPSRVITCGWDGRIHYWD